MSQICCCVHRFYYIINIHLYSIHYRDEFKISGWGTSQEQQNGQINLALTLTNFVSVVFFRLKSQFPN